ncbi:hypothetical protein ACTFIZ_010861 [Dictyostelium cf. discoideum]
MANTVNDENISYIICSTIEQCGYNSNDINYFILTKKEGFLFFKPLTYNSDNSSKLLVQGTSYFTIYGKLFEISCIYFNNNSPHKKTVKVYQTDYCEPDDNFSRYSRNISFCVANMDRSPNACFYFNYKPWNSEK